MAHLYLRVAACAAFLHQDMKEVYDRLPGASLCTTPEMLASVHTLAQRFDEFKHDFLALVTYVKLTQRHREYVRDTRRVYKAMVALMDKLRWDVTFLLFTTVRAVALELPLHWAPKLQRPSELLCNELLPKEATPGERQTLWHHKIMPRVEERLQAYIQLPRVQRLLPDAPSLSRSALSVRLAGFFRGFLQQPWVEKGHLPGLDTAFGALTQAFFH